MPGKLLGHKIVQSRIWYDPTAPIANPEWDWTFTYPITVFTAVRSDMSDNSYSLHDIINILEKKIDSKQPMIPAGPIDRVMMWTNTPGGIGQMQVVKKFTLDPKSRSDEKLVTEKALGDYVDTKASLNDFNVHISDVVPGNKRIHMTDDERTYWNSMTSLALFNKHINDKNVHVTEEQQKYWNAKADSSALDNHLNDTNNPHKVTAEQINTYTRNQIKQLIKDSQTTFFNYKNIYWEFLTDPQEFGLEPFREDNWDPNFVFDYIYNQEYQLNPNIVLNDGTIFTVTDPKLLPDVAPGKRYFALVAKRPPEVDSRAGLVIIYFKDQTKPWTNVAEVEVKNGDLFISYPDRRFYLFSGSVFIEILTTTAINP